MLRFATEHLNKYDVIHFDVQWCSLDAKQKKQNELIDFQRESETLSEAFNKPPPSGHKSRQAAFFQPIITLQFFISIHTQQFNGMRS